MTTIIEAIFFSPTVTHSLLHSTACDGFGTSEIEALRAATRDWMGNDGVTAFFSFASPDDPSNSRDLLAKAQFLPTNSRLVSATHFCHPNGSTLVDRAYGHNVSAGEVKLPTGYKAELQDDEFIAASTKGRPKPADLENIRQLGLETSGASSVLDRVCEFIVSGDECWIYTPFYKPSSVWTRSILIYESFAPNKILHIATPYELTQSQNSSREFHRNIRNATRHLSIAELEYWRFTEPNARVSLEYADKNLDIERVSEKYAFAQRIHVPSSVHYIRDWSEANRDKVRQSLWDACQKANANRKLAAKALRTHAGGASSCADLLAAYIEKPRGDVVLDDFSGAVSFQPGEFDFGLHDKFTSGIRKEWVHLILNHFNEKIPDTRKDRPLLKRRLLTDSSTILRGDSYYANLKQDAPWEICKEYATECKVLSALILKFEKRVESCSGIFQYEGLSGDSRKSAWKLNIALFDQIRNIALLFLSALHFNYVNEQNKIDKISRIKLSGAILNDYYAVLLGLQIPDERAFLVRVADNLTLIGSSFLELGEQAQEVCKSQPKRDLSSLIRSWREADDPIENLALAALAMENLGEVTPDLVVGLFWGGIELPYCLRAIAQLTSAGLGKVGFTSYSRYSAKSPGEPLFFDINSASVESLSAACAGQKSAIIMDDNTLSGSTLQAVSDSLHSAGVKEVSAYVVRFSGERREGQIKRSDSGIINPSYLVERLSGYMGETNFSRSYSDEYNSPVGVFNTSRARILKYLHNNAYVERYKREGF